MPRHVRAILLAAALAAAAPAFAARSHAAVAQTVHFPSADGHTELVGYLFTPAGTGPHPGIVMLHGRAGPYSANVNADCTLVAPGHESPCNASTLSKRHEMWGEYWAAHGYVAVLVDSFGPRERAHGYGRGTHDDPEREAVNERTVRPLDAEGALAWLRTRADVAPGRIMLQGWSNGGSTVLNTVQRQAEAPASAPRFRAALAFYPGCGPKATLGPRLKADIPLWAFLGSDDEEVSPVVCDRFLRAGTGGPIVVTTYPGATHDFDDPGSTRQAVAGNRQAKDDAMGRAADLLGAVAP